LYVHANKGDERDQHLKEFSRVSKLSGNGISLKDSEDDPAYRHVHTCIIGQAKGKEDNFAEIHMKCILASKENIR
jgi:hypothetical protein